MSYSVKEIAQDSQENMSLSTVKRLNSKIKSHGGIMREEGSGRPEKLSEIHKNYILKLIADSPINTSSRIALKLKNNYEVEVHKSTISRFLIEKGYKWKGSQIVYRNNEQDQENRLKFCIKNKERDWSDVLITDEATFYILSPGIHRWVASGDPYEKTKTKYSQKIHVWWAFSSKGIIKFQFFTASKDSKKYVEILKNCRSNIDNLHPNGILLLWDNDSKHKSEMFEIITLKTKYSCYNGQHIVQI